MKNLLTAIIVTTLMSGCNSEQSAQTQTAKPTTPTTPKTKEVVKTVAQDAPVVIEDEPVTTIPLVPLTPPVVTVPLTPLEPSTPIDPPAVTPQPPTLPIFIGEGITTHTQQPYIGTIVKGGDTYLRYNQDAQYFNDFELPEWSVTYRYEPMIEVLITNGSETLCARYSWKKGGFGYARPVCLWSDTRAAVPLEDMQNAYYGYSVIESRVWVNGVVGLRVRINGN